jgi:hypothetical protein
MTGRAELDHRLGDTDRQCVVEILAKHRDAGRLTPEELEDRQLAGAEAQTWSNVVPLFADLPEPYPAGMPVPIGEAVPAQAYPGRGLSGVQRGAVVTLVALAATALFSWNGSWLIFLAIPATTALLRWNDPEEERERSRRERRRSRR